MNELRLFPIKRTIHMTITNNQLNQFQNEGYVICEKFFNEDLMISLKKELDRMLDNGHARNVSTDGDGKTSSNKKVNIQICPLSPISKIFADVSKRKDVLNAVHTLLGENTELHLDQVFLKPANHGTGTNWHQDNAYFKIKDVSKGTGMWIALDDANKENGTMEIVPSSHLQSHEHIRDMHSDHHITCEGDDSKSIAMEVKRGGCVFFNYGIIHCTKENKTNAARAGLALHFVDKNYRVKDDGFL
ncbi:MAG: hypothetical protein COA79_23840 [Planctomycetota bacterium]|nr:MAG: hypothetical protein COA79_23840 [Planctomycetota bacterium]